jgi:hypothetical protein
MNDDSQEVETAETTTTPVEETEPPKPTTFWQKMGNAVKNAVDCCLEN